jgi:hypothetical protein
MVRTNFQESWKHFTSRVFSAILKLIEFIELIRDTSGGLPEAGGFLD